MARKSNTRAAQGSGTIRQRPDGRWEARYVIGTDPGSGKPIRKSVYAWTQKEVRQKMAQAVAAIDNGDYFEPSKITLARWVEIWLEEYTGDKKYLTVKHYKAQCKTHIVPSLGAVKLSELTAPQIQSFYNGLLRGGMAAKSVRNVHGILTKALTVAVSVGYLRDNPASRVTLPKVEKKEIRPLTDKQSAMCLSRDKNASEVDSTRVKMVRQTRPPRGPLLVCIKEFAYPAFCRTGV